MTLIRSLTHGQREALWYVTAWLLLGALVVINRLHRTTLVGLVAFVLMITIGAWTFSLLQRWLDNKPDDQP